MDSEKNELLNHINSYKIDIQNLEESYRKVRNESKEKSIVINNTIAEKEDMGYKLKSYCAHIDSLKDKISKIEIDYDNKLNEMNNMKIIFDQNVDKLVELIKQQNGELQMLDEKCLKYENDNMDLNDMVVKLGYDKEDLYNQIQGLNDDMAKLQDVESLLKQSEGHIDALNLQLESERKRIAELNETLNSTNAEFLKYKDQYKGENSPEYLSTIVAEKDKLINTLNKEISELKQNSSSKDKYISDYEAEFNNYNLFLNSFLHTMIKWIETYFGTSFDRHFNIVVPDLKLEIDGQIKMPKKLKKTLENCYSVLTEIRKRVNTEYNNYDKIINEAKNQNHSLIEEKESLIKENNELKRDNDNLNNELDAANKKIEKLIKEFDQVQDSLNNINNIKTDLSSTSKQYLEYLLNEMKTISDELKQSKLKSFSDIFEKSFSFRENIVNFINSRLIKLKRI
jgi:chromosome segregation ATPase